MKGITTSHFITRRKIQVIRYGKLLHGICRYYMCSQVKITIKTVQSCISNVKTHGNKQQSHLSIILLETSCFIIHQTFKHSTPVNSIIYLLRVIHTVRISATPLDTFPLTHEHRLHAVNCFVLFCFFSNQTYFLTRLQILCPPFCFCSQQLLEAVSIQTFSANLRPYITSGLKYC